MLPVRFSNTALRQLPKSSLPEEVISPIKAFSAAKLYNKFNSFGLMCIILDADEIDAIGTKRYESQSGGEREIQRTMLELLNQMDGFDSMGDVKVQTSVFLLPDFNEMLLGYAISPMVNLRHNTFNFPKAFLMQYCAALCSSTASMQQGVWDEICLLWPRVPSCVWNFC